jgi:hypothetical protein
MKNVYFSLWLSLFVNTLFAQKLFFSEYRPYIGYLYNRQHGAELGIFSCNSSDGTHNDDKRTVPSMMGFVINSGMEYYPSNKLFAPKIAAHIFVMFVELGVETAYYSQFRSNYLWTFKPQIGLTLFGFTTLSYNYNIYKKEELNPIYNLLNRHSLSLIIRWSNFKD